MHCLNIYQLIEVYVTHELFQQGQIVLQTVLPIQFGEDFMQLTYIRDVYLSIFKGNEKRLLIIHQLFCPLHFKSCKLLLSFVISLGLPFVYDPGYFVVG